MFLRLVGSWALGRAFIMANLKLALIMADLNQKFNMADLNQNFDGQTINLYYVLSTNKYKSPK